MRTKIVKSFACPLNNSKQEFISAKEIETMSEEFKYIDLLSNPMKVKPASKRVARQKSSYTPPHVIRMNYNESHYGMPPKAKEALATAIERPNVYPDWFSVHLKDAVADLYGVEQANVVPGSGSSAIIDMLGEIFINEGDEVILGDISYEAFRDVVNDFGGKTVLVKMTEDLKYDLDGMLAAITPKTKMLVVCNPNNPTATFIDSSIIEDFIKKVPEHVIVIIDEAYIEFVTKENTYSMTKLIKEGYKKPLIVLRTFSKIYGMAGIRVGYAVTDFELAAHLNKASSAWNLNAPGQIAAAAAIKEQDFIKDVRDKVAQQRETVSKKLEELGCRVYESWTNFILFSAPVESTTVQAKLAEKDILIGAPEGYCRVSLATPEIDKKFLDELEKIIYNCD